MFKSHYKRLDGVTVSTHPVRHISVFFFHFCLTHLSDISCDFFCRTHLALSDISCMFLSFASDITSCGHIWLCRTYLAGTRLRVKKKSLTSNKSLWGIYYSNQPALCHSNTTQQARYHARSERQCRVSNGKVPCHRACCRNRRFAFSRRCGEVCTACGIITKRRCTIYDNDDTTIALLYHTARVNGCPI